MYCDRMVSRSVTTACGSFQVVKDEARIGVDGCLLMICRWMAALCRGGRAGEVFKERDCFKGASSGCWRLKKGRPLRIRQCRWYSSLMRRSGRKRGDRESAGG